MYKKPVVIVTVLTICVCVFVTLMYNTGDSAEDLITQYLNTVNRTRPTYITATTTTSSTKPELPVDQQEPIIVLLPEEQPLPGIPSRPTITGSWLTQLEARNNTYYTDTYWTVVDSNGSQYLCERQTGNAYRELPSHSNSISKKGCMMYAIQAVVTNMTGQLFSIEDQLNVRNGVASWDGTHWSVVNYPYKENGSDKIGNGGPNTSLSARLNALNNEYGLSFSCSGDMAGSSINSINDVLTSGKWLIIHVTGDNGRKYSSGGEHWFVICGIDSAGTWYFLQCKQKNSIVTDTDKNELIHLANHIYAISAH